MKTAKNSGSMWECECGYVTYGQSPPPECKECNTLGKFSRVPEDMIAEKEEEAILSIQGDEEDED